MHRATVSVDDRPGGGAVFTLQFPRVLPVERAARELDAVS
jgi:signal transduction histidine kinase